MVPHLIRTLCVAPILAVGLSGCGPKNGANTTPPADAPAATGLTAPEAAPPPALPPPRSPIGLAPATAVGAPVLPPLSGAQHDLDMVTLTHRTQTFTIEADTSMFQATDPRVAARLQLAFQFDPRWRVGLWEGQSVAWARSADAKGWSAPYGGYRSGDGYTLRSLFRFQVRPDDHPWTASGLVARNAAGSRSMQVVAWKVDQGPWEGQMAAAFTIDGMGMSLEVHELAPQLTLAGTQSDLQQATLRTKAIADQVARGHLQRTSLAMVPKGEPRLGTPFVQVSSTETGLDVRGRVNPGRMGWTWIRILDATGTPWAEEPVAVASAERIGWDANPEVLAYFQSSIPAPSSPPASGTVQVWFDADDREEVKLVGEFAFGTGTGGPG